MLLSRLPNLKEQSPLLVIEYCDRFKQSTYSTDTLKPWLFKGKLTDSDKLYGMLNAALAKIFDEEREAQFEKFYLNQETDFIDTFSNEFRKNLKALMSCLKDDEKSEEFQGVVNDRLSELFYAKAIEELITSLIYSKEKTAYAAFGDESYSFYLCFSFEDVQKIEDQAFEKFPDFEKEAVFKHFKVSPSDEDESED